MNPPSTGETWEATYRLLERMPAWVKTHPEDALPVTHAHERAEWVAVTAAVDVPGVEALPDLPDSVVETPAWAPKGWDLLARLPALEKGRCRDCGAPALIGTADRYRCAAHPPKVGEWGARMDWTPKAQATCAPTRCCCGRCPHWTPM